MSNIIKPKRSNVVGKIPTTSDIEVGEIALNMADSILYFKDASNVVKSIGSSSFAIDNLSDVVITSAVSGNVLMYNGTNWINSSLNSIVEW